MRGYIPLFFYCILMYENTYLNLAVFRVSRFRACSN
nr:MAG TPA: hypothetical protein [Caudoviricetes sp.]